MKERKKLLQKQELYTEVNIKKLKGSYYEFFKKS